LIFKSKILGREHCQNTEEFKKCNVIVSTGMKERQASLLKAFQNEDDMLNRLYSKVVSLPLEGEEHMSQNYSLRIY
jgi:hypothetical protein